MSNERQVLGRRVSPERARAWSLVLSSMRIPHAIEAEEGGRVSIRVREAHREAAERQIRLWRREHDLARRAEGGTGRASQALPLTGLYCVLVLLGLHLVSEGRYQGDMLEAGSLAVGKVMQGEYWRLMTAMTLHADWGHLFSNMFFGWIVLTALAMLVGSGRAVVLALSGGLVANIVNVCVHTSQYTALGFSNAVFSLLGALVCVQWRQRSACGEGRGGRLIVGAGIALFALVGLSEGSDLTGHLVGLVFGMSAALVFGKREVRRRSISDVVCLGVACVSVAASWVFALGAV